MGWYHALYIRRVGLVLLLQIPIFIYAVMATTSIKATDDVSNVQVPAVMIEGLDSMAQGLLLYPMVPLLELLY